MGDTRVDAEMAEIDEGTRGGGKDLTCWSQEGLPSFRVETN